MVGVTWGVVNPRSFPLFTSRFDLYTHPLCIIVILTLYSGRSYLLTEAGGNPLQNRQRMLEVSRLAR